MDSMLCRLETGYVPRTSSEDDSYSRIAAAKVLAISGVLVTTTIMISNAKKCHAFHYINLAYTIAYIMHEYYY